MGKLVMGLPDRNLCAGPELTPNTVSNALKTYRFLQPFPLAALIKLVDAPGPRGFWVKPERDVAAVMPAWAIAASPISNPEEVVWLSAARATLQEVVRDWNQGFTPRSGAGNEAERFLELLGLHEVASERGGNA